MGATARWFKALIGIKKIKTSDGERDALRSTINSKSKRWLVWKLGSSKAKNEQQEKNQSMLCESQRYLHSEEFDRSQRHLEGLKTHWAAIRIQCAFRRLLARRALKALRAIVRIQAIVRGRLVRRRAAENHNLFIEFQSSEPKRREWCDYQGSAEEIEARRRHKCDAALRRERAMAYAVLHQAGKRAEFWQLWQREQVEQQVLQARKLRLLPEIAISYFYSGPIFPSFTSSSTSVVSCAREHHDMKHVHCNGFDNIDEGLRGGISPSVMRPGYMEATISMKAKCKPNLGNTRRGQQSSCYYPRHVRSLGRQRHSSVACLDTNHLLLQCR